MLKPNNYDGQMSTDIAQVIIENEYFVSRMSVPNPRNCSFKTNAIPRFEITNEELRNFLSSKMPKKSGSVIIITLMNNIT